MLAVAACRFDLFPICLVLMHAEVYSAIVSTACVSAVLVFFFFFFSSRRRHTRSDRDWSSDVCSSDLLGRRGKRGQLVPRVSPRRRVELIGLVDQLRSSDKVKGSDRPEAYRHFQPAQKIVHAFRRSEQSLAFGVCSVLRGALPVFDRETDGFEIPCLREAGHETRGILGEFWHRYHGKAFADARPLDRVVVYEDEAIEADIQSRRNGLEVFRLVMPVCDEGGDISSLKNHFRVIFKHRLSSRRIVLGADGKNDSA